MKDETYKTNTDRCVLDRKPPRWNPGFPQPPCENSRDETFMLRVENCGIEVRADRFVATFMLLAATNRTLTDQVSLKTVCFLLKIPRN